MSIQLIQPSEDDFISNLLEPSETSSKLCKSCIEVKNKSLFHIDKSRKDGLYPYCKKCAVKLAYRSRLKNIDKYKITRDKWLKKTNYNTVYQRKWRPDNKEKTKFYKVKSTYKVTKKEYFAILASQDNKCGICDKELTDTTRAFDHCHITNKNRGFLCTSCNSKLGWYEKRKHKIMEWLK